MRFQIVDDDLPIPGTGILGMPFLENQNAIMKFGNDESNSLQIGDGQFFLLSFSSFSLSPRTKTLITLPVKDSVELEAFTERPPSPRSSRTGNPNVDQSRADSNRLVQIASIR